MNVLFKTGRYFPQSWRLFLLAVAFSCFGGVANAQDNEEDSEPGALVDDSAVELIDEVTVTGSRLKRSTFTSVSPLQVVDGETARDLGLINAQDVLTNTTVISGQQNTVGLTTVFQGALAQAFSTIGSATPSLRGLGSSVTGRSRSLILIDGRRLGPIGVGGAPANPDVSMIPGTLIERTEILLDGASSVYGSDAVGGVINYIMRKDFDGVELSAQTSQSQYGWGTNNVISLATGLSSDNGFFSLAVEYSEQDEITVGDVLSDFWGSGATGGALCDAGVGEYNDGRRVETCMDTPAGWLLTGAGNIIADTEADGALTPINPFPGVPGFYIRDDGGNYFRPVNDPTINGFPENHTESFLPEIERTSFFVTGEYAVADNHDFFFEGMFANRELRNYDWNQNVLAVSDETAFNPFGVGGLFVYSYENGVAQEIDVARMVAGVRGDLPGFTFGDNWGYEVFAQGHRSTGFQSRGPFLHEERLVQGMSATMNPDTGEYECPLDTGDSFFGFDQNGSPLSCVPLNPFVPSFFVQGRFATDAENEYVYGYGNTHTRVEQNIAGGYITGEIGSFPDGGPIQILFGVEGRTDKVRTTPDDNMRLGLMSDLDADAGANGERWIKEAFGEFSLPLLEGRRFAERLTIEGAVRYTDEEFSGDDTTYQVKLEYAPTDYLSFRGGTGTSFRAPDTGEQFGTGTVFVQNSRADPCMVSSLYIDPVTNTYVPELETRSETVLENCYSLGLDPTTLGTAGYGTPTMAYTTFPVAFGNFGFKEVEPETSEAWFAGFTLDQPWTDAFDLSLAVTWYDYVIEGSIGQLTRARILGDCMESAGMTDPLCTFMTRGSNGILTDVNEASINLGETTSAGVDVNLRAGFDVAGADIQWDILWTHSTDNTEDVLGDGEINDLLGTIEIPGAFPEDQVVSTLNASYGDFGVIWRLRFISDLFGSPSDSNNSFQPCYDPDLGGKHPDCTIAEFTEDYFQSDLFGVYRGESWTFRLGVTNLFDEVQKVHNTIAQSGVAIQSGHDIYGRRITFGVEAQF
jgi:iron complex outermembrane receptor protein